MPPVKPTKAKFDPTVLGILMGNDVVKVFAGTVRSVMVMVSVEAL